MNIDTKDPVLVDMREFFASRQRDNAFVRRVMAMAEAHGVKLLEHQVVQSGLPLDDLQRGLIAAMILDGEGEI